MSLRLEDQTGDIALEDGASLLLEGESAGEGASAPSSSGAIGGGGSSSRYRGSRQRYKDGEWEDDDEGLEEVGTPTPFVPPEPWTPEPDLVPVAAPKGRKSLGIRTPKPTPRSVARSPARPATPKKSSRPDDDDALSVLLAAMTEVWG